MGEQQPYINLSDISHLAVYLQATEKQMLAAYSSALNRTSIWLKTHAGRMAKQGLEVRRLQLLRKRMGYYRRKAAAGNPDVLKFWFGLNAIPISQLKGKISGRRGKRHARRDKKTGRYIKRRKSGVPPGFTPKGGALPETRFENGFIGKSHDGKRTILVRGKYRTLEAAIDIRQPMVDDVISQLIRELPSEFMKHYEKELKYRVKSNLRVDGRGRRL